MAEEEKTVQCLTTKVGTKIDRTDGALGNQSSRSSRVLEVSRALLPSGDFR